MSYDPADILVSYISKDRKWGERIAAILREEYEVVVAMEDGSVSASASLAVALTWSRRVVPVLSKASLGSNEEVYWQMWCAADPLREQRRLIPILIQPCKFAGFLGSITYIDLTDKPMAASGTASYLLTEIRSGRRTLVNPPFPG